MSVDAINSLIAKARETSAQRPESDAAAAAQREQLARIASEFESMLLGQMLRDMRNAGKWEDESGEGGKNEFAAMFETLDVELVSKLSQQGGLGLGKELLKGLERSYKPSAAAEIQGTLKMGVPSGSTTTEAVIAAMKQSAAGFVDTGSAKDVVATTGIDQTAMMREALMRAGVRADVAAAYVGSTDQSDVVRDALGSLGIGAGVAGAGFGRRDVEAVGTAYVAAAAAAPAGLEGVTSEFGIRRDPINGRVRFHKGLDLRAAYGQEVRSAADGRIAFEGTQRGYGNTVVVEHADGVRTRYAHLSAADVREGDVVVAGQVIGRAGHSGRATGTHLHFEVMAGGRHVDPAAWLAGQPLKPEPEVADLTVGRTGAPESRGDRHEN